jgi:hypothetical protein
MAELERLELGSQTAIINPENLRFNETNLKEYLQTESGYYDNFGACLALAEKILQQVELQAERLYSASFAEWKDNGGSDKLAEARAKADTAVIAANELVIEAKYKVKRLQQHLRAWDKNHDNAQSLGHMLRKEMEKLNADIKFRQDQFDAWVDADVDARAARDVPPAE